MEKGCGKLQAAGCLSKQVSSRTGLASRPECCTTCLLLPFLSGDQSSVVAPSVPHLPPFCWHTLAACESLALMALSFSNTHSWSA